MLLICFLEGFSQIIVAAYLANWKDWHAESQLWKPFWRWHTEGGGGGGENYYYYYYYY